MNYPYPISSCPQACENSIPPTIKSVVFSGHSYDRFLLTPIGGAAQNVQVKR